MLILNPSHKNVKSYLEQIQDDMIYNIEKNMKELKSVIDTENLPIFIEYSVINCQANADMVAIPLLDGNFYIKADDFSCLDEGDIIDENELLMLLQNVELEYENKNLMYYYDI